MAPPNTEILTTVFKKHKIGKPKLQLFKRNGALDSYGQNIPGKAAFSVWQALSINRQNLGYCPLLINDSCWFDQTFARPVEKIINEGVSIVPTKWLATRRNEYPRIFKNRAYRGEWPKKKDSQRFSNNKLNLVQELHVKGGQVTINIAATVFLALIPVEASWMLPAYLLLGGWNDCPTPETQVCMQRYWHRKHGAEMMALGKDFYEFYVSNPPQTRKAALLLAKEQFTYCYDIVDQGTNTVEGLAACLYKAPNWFFWWD